MKSCQQQEVSLIVHEIFSGIKFIQEYRMMAWEIKQQP